MKSRKKIVIGFSVLLGVLAVAIVSLSAVLAAFQATSTGGFQVNYTAYNVNATITGQHKTQSGGWADMLTANKDSANQNKTIEFGEFTGFKDLNKTSDTFTATTLNMKKGELYWVRFAITNKSVNDPNTTSDNIIFNGGIDNFDNLGNKNLRAYGFVKNTGNTINDSDISSLVNSATGENSDFSAFNNVTIQPGWTCYVFIAFRIVNPTVGLTGYSDSAVQFNFLLTVAE